MTGVFARLVEAFDKTIQDWKDGWLGVVQRASQSFDQTHAGQAAAAMAYYAIFSLFPLLLVLVSVISSFVADERARQEAVRLVTEAIPVSRQLIQQNVERILALRGPVRIVGLVGLLWSATAFFTVLAYNVNRAWSDAEPRGFVRRRLVGLAMVGILFVLLVLSLLSSAVFSLLPRLQVPFLGRISVYETILWAVISRMIPLVFTFLLFLTLYRWVPNTRVSWRVAFGGGLLVAVAWEIVKSVFVWYLGSGLVQYELVYGSLSAVVILMVWIYLSSWIALFGAHFSAALAAGRGADRD